MKKLLRALFPDRTFFFVNDSAMFGMGNGNLAVCKFVNENGGTYGNLTAMRVRVVSEDFEPIGEAFFVLDDCLVKNCVCKERCHPIAVNKDTGVFAMTGNPTKESLKNLGVIIYKFASGF